MPHTIVCALLDVAMIAESFIGEDADGLAAFLIGFHSHAQAGVAHIHFVGVRPDLRQAGLARTL